MLIARQRDEELRMLFAINVSLYAEMLILKQAQTKGIFYEGVATVSEGNQL